MAVELEGNVRMRGDTGPGVVVRVSVASGHLRIVTGDEVVGDWLTSDIGIHALNEGFAIRAEGEEFILRTSDDAAVAEELHLAAATPRLARQVAARHKPKDRADSYVEPEPMSSNLGAVGLGVAGALVLLGGTFLNITPGDATSGSSSWWVAFVIAGVVMLAAAYVMSVVVRVGRIVSIAVVAGVIVLFITAVSRSDADAGVLTAYGFIAGGLVVGVAVLFSGSLRPPG